MNHRARVFHSPRDQRQQQSEKVMFWGTRPDSSGAVLPDRFVSLDAIKREHTFLLEINCRTLLTRGNSENSEQDVVGATVHPRLDIDLRSIFLLGALVF